MAVAALRSVLLLLQAAVAGCCCSRASDLHSALLQAELRRALLQGAAPCLQAEIQESQSVLLQIGSAGIDK